MILRLQNVEFLLSQVGLKTYPGGLSLVHKISHPRGVSTPCKYAFKGELELEVAGLSEINSLTGEQELCLKITSGPFSKTLQFCLKKIGNTQKHIIYP